MENRVELAALEAVAQPEAFFGDDVACDSPPDVMENACSASESDDEPPVISMDPVAVQIHMHIHYMY